MTPVEEIFESATRPKGDLAGVFEHDGDTGYFYLYRAEPRKVLAAIHILSGHADFGAPDVHVRWTEDGSKVGLFIRGIVWAVFDGARLTSFGGNYRPAGSPSIPRAALEGF